MISCFSSLALSRVGGLSWSLVPKNDIQNQIEKESFVDAILRPP